MNKELHNQKSKEMIPLTLIGAFKTKDKIVLVADSRIIKNKITGRYEDGIKKIFEIDKNKSYILVGGKMDYFNSIKEVLIFNELRKKHLSYILLNQIAQNISNDVLKYIKNSLDKWSAIINYKIFLIFVSNKGKIFSLEYRSQGMDFSPIDYSDRGYCLFTPIPDLEDKILIDVGILNEKKKLKSLHSEDMKAKIEKAFQEFKKETLFISDEKPTIKEIRLTDNMGGV